MTGSWEGNIGGNAACRRQSQCLFGRGAFHCGGCGQISKRYSLRHFTRKHSRRRQKPNGAVVCDPAASDGSKSPSERLG